MIDAIKIRGARVHNLKNIDVDVPLNKIVGIAGVSGSGKSSLALGVLYAEGSRRYLDALSTYTRRRMTQAAKAQVDEVLYVPAALALHQRPGVPGIRSTFGTGTELLNSLRLMFSRLASHRCPNGHYVPPTLNVAAEQPIYCPECGALVRAPSAEELAFNSQGACRTCDGTGLVRTVDRATLVPDESISIDDGAVAPWNSLMWSLMTDVCRAMGVRTNVPFRELTDRERDIVFNGPAEKKHIFYKAKSTPEAGELDFTYYNAVYTVENALAKVKDEKGMKRVEKFLRVDTCPDCRGSRLSEAARAPRLRGIGLADACRMTLDTLVQWVEGVPASLPVEMRPMAESICESFQATAARLLDLGLGYLSLDREAATLSTGERQRVQLARSVRNRTTGVLYVLDEPSIGLHPSNIEGLRGVMHDLIADGNSIVLVDHDTEILRDADWLIEMGPGAGENGGTILTQGTVEQVAQSPASRIGPFLADLHTLSARTRTPEAELFALGTITLRTRAIHTVKPLEVRLPKGRLIAVTGVSGSGKSMSAKEEIVQIALSTEDDILILDPESEFGYLTEALGGEVIRISATSDTHINALDMDRAYGDERNPIVSKSEFVLSLFEQLIGDGMVTAKEKSILGRCTEQVYLPYIRNGYKGTPPTLQDFYRLLQMQPEPEAQGLALSSELFITGTLNTFARHTNVDTQARIIAYDIRELGEQLMPLGMLVTLDAIYNRVIQNWKKGRRTWIFCDEFYILFRYEYSANFFYKLWKRIRKYNGLVTGLTQNVDELLRSDTARLMLANSEFLVMLNQSATDRAELAKLLNISDNQLGYVTNVPAGCGLIRCAGNIVPFTNSFPKNTKLYKLMSTNPSEKRE